MRCVVSELAALPRARRRVPPPPPRVARAPRAGGGFLHFHLGLPALGQPGPGDAMAWRSHGSDNGSLVDALKRNKVIQDARCVAPASTSAVASARSPRGGPRREHARAAQKHHVAIMRADELTF